jgi:peroxiredoxin
MKEKFLILLSITALLTLFSEGISCSPGASPEIASNEINNATPPAIGNQAPDFTAINVAGKTVALSDFRGKNILLNFWSVWCDQCDMEMGFFETVHREHPEIQIMAVNAKDDMGTIQRFVRSSNFTFPIYIDQTGMVARIYDVHLIPKTFLIDSSGIIKYIQDGAFDTQTQLENALKLF